MMRKIKKIGLVFGLLFAVLMMSTPMLDSICRGENEDPLTPQLPLKVGDLLFMDNKGDDNDVMIGLYNDHVVLCVDNTTPGNELFIQAYGNVNYCNFSYLTGQWEIGGWDTFLIARVKGIQPWQIDDAVEWATHRIGEPYQHWELSNWTVEKWYTPNDPEHPNSTGWYCSELVWAAYYNIEPKGTFDIDNNEWAKHPYGKACVNMGCFGECYIPEWMKNYICPYIFKNEIQIDDNISTVWKETAISGFLPGAQIQLESGGTVNIENVQVGDVVASYDVRQDQIVPARVTNIYCYDAGEVTGEFIVINGDFQVTANHVLYINNCWVRARDIKVGDESLSYSGGNPQMITINEVETEYHRASCYALELDSGLGVLASYFVDGTLVCE